MLVLIEVAPYGPSARGGGLTRRIDVGTILLVQDTREACDNLTETSIIYAR